MSVTKPSRYRRMRPGGPTAHTLSLPGTGTTDVVHAERSDDGDIALLIWQDTAASWVTIEIARDGRLTSYGNHHPTIAEARAALGK